MHKSSYKGRCNKRYIKKSEDVCRTYNDLQFNYLQILEDNENVVSVECNVPIESESGEQYTTDFVCTKKDGEIMVRECVLRKHLTKPSTVNMLDISREYWFNRGILDWGLVIDAVKE